MAGIVDIGNALGAPLKALIDKLVPDRAAAAAAKSALDAQMATGALAQEMAQLVAVTSAQTDINKVEAASASLFIAGWRPYVGWICGTGLGMDCIVRPLVNWIAALCGHPVDFPVLSNALLQSTMAGLLGLGHIARTVEKVQGVVGKH